MLLAMLGAGSAGLFLAVGSAANARLRQALHSAIAAAAINFLTGFSFLTFFVLLGLFPAPQLAQFLTVPWWAFAGGLCGAIFVSLSTVTVPKLGLTTNTLVVVCGQMTLSLVIDQLGWLGVTVHPLSPLRVLAIPMLIAAIALTQFDHPDLPLRHPQPRIHPLP